MEIATTPRPRRLAALCLLVGLIGAGTCLGDAAPHSVPGLGSLHFPTSTRSAAAQAAFEEGMLNMHLFEYPLAEQAFLRAQALDPGFVMAYWAEAMSYTHPVWNQQDMQRGRAALAKLGATADERAARTGSEREKGYLAAVEAYYGAGDKPARDRRHLEAMAALSAKFPDDDEARLFHALALLGVTQGERDIANFLRAAKLARAAAARNPQHPGAAHYWIHGMDDPEHAGGALEAARALSKIAPAAGHAQHMTSHIFVALGMWDDVVASNLSAEQVTRALSQSRDQPAYSCGHYIEWLEYAYFQQGRRREGVGLLQRCRQEGSVIVDWHRAHADQRVSAARTPAMLKQRIDGSLALMRGMAIVDAPEHAGLATSLAIDGDPEGNDPWVLFGPAFDQAQRGDARAATVAAELKTMETRLGGQSEYARAGTLAGIMGTMIDAALAGQAGKHAAALQAADSAVARYDALPVDFGPPASVKPPHELRGELLLAAGRPADALVDFDAALKAAPNRAAAMLGRARALQAIGDPAAKAAYAALLAQWVRADAQLPELDEVKVRSR